MVVFELHQLDPAHGANQFSRLALDAELAQQVAGIVIGDAGAKARADVFDLEDPHQEFRKLENPSAERFRLLKPLRVVGKELAVKDPDHGGAGARRRHNVLGVPEDVEHARGDFPSFLAKAGVKGRLAAAGLRRVKRHLAARVTQHTNRALADFGKKLIAEAGNK